MKSRNLPPTLALLSAVALFGAAAQAQAAAFVRAPYVGKTSQTESTIAFRLDQKCPATLRYGTNGQMDKSVQSAASAADHALTLTGLKASTDVTYQVEACGSLIGKPATFRTAPPAGTRSVHFAAVGDFGTGHRIQSEVGALILEARPELFLGLGDVAYNDGSDAEVTNNMLKQMAPLFAVTPYYVALGNHEYVTPDARPTVDAIHMPTNNPRGTERYYSFDWGPVHFVVLDSMCTPNNARGDLCDDDEQVAWVEQDLKANQGKNLWTIVMWHHPAYSSTSEKVSREMRDEVVPILEKYGVDLTLTGHAHNYERSKPIRAGKVAQGGMTHVVAGFGGAKLKYFDSTTPPAWSQFRQNVDFGYLDIKVDGGTLVAEARTLASGVIDRFTLTKDVPDAPAQPVEPDEPVDSEQPGQPSQPGNGTTDPDLIDPGIGEDPEDALPPPDGALLPGDGQGNQSCAMAGGSFAAALGLVALLRRRRR